MRPACRRLPSLARAGLWAATLVLLLSLIPAYAADFGDAPTNYPTLLLDNGARHAVTNAGPTLGAFRDEEPDGQPSPNASGDDDIGDDDEDGVLFLNALRAGEPADALVFAPDGGVLDAFIDFDRNGQWTDAHDRVANALALTPGFNLVTFTVPSGASAGLSCARFRLSTAGGLGPAGPAPDGEVEDYAVEIVPVVDVALTLTGSADPVGVGTTLAYTLRLTNAGPSAAGTLLVQQALPPGVAFTAASAGCTNDSGLVTCVLPGLAAGGSVTLDVSVTVTNCSAPLLSEAGVTSAESDSDPFNNAALLVTTAMDSEPPVLTLLGAATMEADWNGAFNDPGATATDACAGAVPVNVTGSVDSTTLGLYTLTYSATDGLFTTTTQRVVKVRPVNDNFAGRLNLPEELTFIEINHNNSNATSEPNEPTHAGLPPAATLWWRWTPPPGTPPGALVRLDTLDSSFDTVLAVYFEHDALNALVPVAANDDVGYGHPATSNHVASTRSSVQFALAAGSNYVFAVGGKGGARGAVTLRLAPVLAPNERMASSVSLGNVTSATVTGNNTGATPDPFAPPTLAGQAMSNPAWWHWTPPADTDVELITLGSGFDTVLGVFTVDGNGALQLVAENDDAPGGTYSALQFFAAAGQPILIVVDGYNLSPSDPPSAGNITLTLSTQLRPANDHFANRIGLGNAANLSLTADTRRASAEAGEPSHAGQSPHRTLWWSWTAPSSGFVRVETLGSSFDTVLAVYTGHALGSLAQVLANDNGGFGPLRGGASLQSSAQFFATSGTPYAIALGGYSDEGGDAMLTLRPVLVPNERPDSSLGLGAGSIVSVTGTNNGAAPDALGPATLVGQPVSNPAWWHWTAPATIEMLATTFSSDFDTVLGVFTRDAGGSFQLVASSDDPPDGFGLHSVATFVAQSNATYYFLVDGYNQFATNPPAAGRIVLTLSPLAHPVVLLTPQITTNGVVVRFTGAPLRSYSLRRTPAFPAAWTTVSIATTDASGVGEYVESAPLAGNAFFRVQFP